MVSPSALTSRKVWTPKPSIVRNERGMPRSLMFHMTWCVASVCSDTKSQNVSWADCAWGISTVGLGLGGVDDVGELDAVLDEEHRHVVADQVEGALVGVELHREPSGVTDGVRRPREPSTVENRVKTRCSCPSGRGTRPWSPTSAVP